MRRVEGPIARKSAFRSSNIFAQQDRGEARGLMRFALARNALKTLAVGRVTSLAVSVVAPHLMH